MNKEVLLSIIIPVYNAKYYIDECLSSILNQGNKKLFEVVIVDDGSTDDSLRIVKKYMSDNIKILHHSNHGVSYSRNRGLVEANGKYVMFVDIDDVLLPGGINRCLIACEENEEDIIIFSNRLKKLQPKKMEMVGNIVGIPQYKYLGNLGAPWSKIYKKNFIINNNIYFDTYIINGEDGLFNINAIMLADSIKYTPFSIYKYRHSRGSSTKNYNKRFFESNIKYLQSLETLLTENKMENEVDRYMARAFVYSIYLYLFLLSTIKNHAERSFAFNRMNDYAIKNYFVRYKTSNDCDIFVRFVYFCARNISKRFALFIMVLLNSIKNKTQRDETWEII